MNEAFAADGDADVQFLVRESHEYKIARPKVGATGLPARSCSRAVRGTRMPAAFAAYTTRPLQSKPLGAAPPKR
jgi:hypothetical protein